MDDFYAKKFCDRCGKPLEVSMMSMMNEDTLCLECISEEKRHPRYKEAVEAELEQVKAHNYNYRGLFAGQKYPFGNNILRGK